MRLPRTSIGTCTESASNLSDEAAKRGSAMRPAVVAARQDRSNARRVEAYEAGKDLPSEKMVCGRETLSCETPVLPGRVGIRASGVLEASLAAEAQANALHFGRHEASGRWSKPNDMRVWGPSMKMPFENSRV